MKALERRLNALEQQSQRPGVLGIRCFQESDDTAGVFYEMPGAFYDGPQGYTRADLGRLSEVGWQLIIVMYGQEG